MEDSGSDSSIDYVYYHAYYYDRTTQEFSEEKNINKFPRHISYDMLSKIVTALRACPK